MTKTKTRVQLLVLADYASISKNGKLSINGIFDQIFSRKFPSKFLRMFLVAVVEGEPDETRDIDLRIISPEKKDILSPKKQKVRFGDNGRTNIIADIANLPLPVAGIYQIKILEGIRELASTSLRVIKVENNSGIRH